uniref:Uncharacterized protein n=1 Tax=Cryptomonas curvata TaxID=233186 RepID=A0A7S0MA74_9CRYP|mmetsp:Transcript_31702/g.66329  ORF Transcript_31702/g.66329 Transcript_31702/m.66329 type:complete len:130 (+) Transcript_31702:92-481(+)
MSIIHARNRCFAAKRSTSATDLFLTYPCSSDEEDAMLDTEWLTSSHYPNRSLDVKRESIGSPLSACLVSNFTADELCLETSDNVSKKVRALRFDDADSDLELRTACCQVVSIGAFQDWDIDCTLVNCRY